MTLGVGVGLRHGQYSQRAGLKLEAPVSLVTTAKHAASEDACALHSGMSSSSWVDST